MPFVSEFGKIKVKPFSYRQEEDAKLVFFLETEEIFLANETSFFILTKLKNDIELPQIFLSLTQEYDVDPDVARAETVSFVNKLLALGLLEGVES